MFPIYSSVQLNNGANVVIHSTQQAKVFRVHRINPHTRFMRQCLDGSLLAQTKIDNDCVYISIDPNGRETLIVKSRNL